MTSDISAHLLLSSRRLLFLYAFRFNCAYRLRATAHALLPNYISDILQRAV